MHRTSDSAPILPADDMALVSMQTVMPIVGYRDSAIYERVALDTFPRPLRLSRRCSRFRAGDIREYLRAPLEWSPDKAIDSRAAEVTP